MAHTGGLLCGLGEPVHVRRLERGLACSFRPLLPANIECFNVPSPGHLSPSLSYSRASNQDSDIGTHGDGLPATREDTEAQKVTCEVTVK